MKPLKVGVIVVAFGQAFQTMLGKKPRVLSCQRSRLNELPVSPSTMLADEDGNTVAPALTLANSGEPATPL